MTRINTNVSSLNAQKSLARSNMQLQESLTRLSTGLRINVGKDDPAGLIASEVLRSDIISVQRAVTNSERANQMIATADSSLGQVSSLLNDIRGLVSDAANTGALSAEQIAANQLQVDSSLEAIDRIAQVTAFQGKRLLDGSMDFITTGVSDSISNLQIDQANFGTQTEIGVKVDVVAQAEKAALSYNSSTIADDVVLEVGGSKGFEAFNFAAGSTIEEMAAAINLVSDALGVEAAVTYNTATEDRAGSTVLTTAGSANNITVTADTAGRTGGDIAIRYTVVNGGGDTTAAWTAATSTTPGYIDVSLDASSWVKATTNATDIDAAAGAATLKVDANVAGAQFNGLKVTITTAGAVAATYDYDTNTISVGVAAGGSDDDVAASINATLGTMFTATGSGGDVAAVANTYTLTQNVAGVDGGVISSTIKAVYDALNDDVGTHVTATGDDAAADNTTKVTPFTHYAMFGTENTGATNDANNRLQFLAPDGASDIAIEFVKAGTYSSLSISPVVNATTNGYSTAIVQGALADASVKIVAKEAGTQYDGVTVSFVQDNTKRDVIWDAEAKEITVYNNFTAGVTAAAVVTQINAALDGDGTASSGLFTASVFGSDGTANVAAGADQATFSGGNQYTKITVNLATDANGDIMTTADQLATYVNASTVMQALGISVSHVGTSTGAGLMTTGSTSFQASGITTSDGYAEGTTNNQGGTNAQLKVTALNAGADYDDVKIVFRHDAGIGAGTTDERVVFDSLAKELNIYIDSGTSTLQDVLDNFTASNNPTDFALFGLEAIGTGGGTLYSTDTGSLTGGVVTSGTSKGVALSGNYNKGDVIGTTGLTFTSADYGSKEFVSVNALQGTFQTTDAEGQIRTRDTGEDINVRLNGIQAITEGLQATMNTSVLDLTFSLDASVAAGTSMNFQITSGGAQFQLGPDVVSNQQARLGIQSVSTAKLGGVSGRLFELRSGGIKALDADVSGAASVVEEVITQVTTLRGRLGAFQKTTLETNINSLNDTLENLTEAESSIRDADFAAESAALTRAQILVQSGVSVLGIANSNPQNVLALLR